MLSRISRPGEGTREGEEGTKNRGTFLTERRERERGNTRREEERERKQAREEEIERRVTDDDERNERTPTHPSLHPSCLPHKGPRRKSANVQKTLHYHPLLRHFTDSFFLSFANSSHAFQIVFSKKRWAVVVHQARDIPIPLAFTGHLGRCRRRRRPPRPTSTASSYLLTTA